MSEEQVQKEGKRFAEVLAERHELARQEIAELLSHYELGWDIFKKPSDWDVPVILKPESERMPEKDVPRQWLGVVEKVGSILAKTKYQLETYPNRIQVIDSEQMLDAYAHIGLPYMYSHWSFGLDMLQQQKQYDEGRMGLAYEIVINTDPGIAYCMGENKKFMQMLVIMHACFGHNSFFKRNYLFTEFTDADSILSQVARMKEKVDRYREEHGFEEVDRVLDAAHALSSYAVDTYKRPFKRSPKEERTRIERIRETERQNYDDLMERTAARTKTVGSFEKAAHPSVPDQGEENILRYIAKYAPTMPEWKRDLITRYCDIQQYFYPQGLTQVMNEGTATFWHHTMMNDLFDMGLADDSIMIPFIHSHTSVVFQPKIGDKYYNGFNPYALGFEMFKDIKRICENPTDEDREQFPHWAGCDDWVSKFDDIVRTVKDESFISQYLSPKMMRDWRLFSIRDDDKDSMLEVSAIHNSDGYSKLRREFSQQYNRALRVPRIMVADYDFRNSRSLTLRHIMQDRRPLAEDATAAVLHHAHTLWEFPVILQSVDRDENVIKKTLSFPANAAVPEKMRTLTPG